MKKNYLKLIKFSTLSVMISCTFLVSQLSFAGDPCEGFKITLQNASGSDLYITKQVIDSGTVSGGTPTGGIVPNNTSTTWVVETGDGLWDLTSGSVYFDTSNVYNSKENAELMFSLSTPVLLNDHCSGFKRNNNSDTLDVKQSYDDFQYIFTVYTK